MTPCALQQHVHSGLGLSAAAAALAAAKAAASSAGHLQAVVTGTRRFAGKDIQVRLPPTQDRLYLSGRLLAAWWQACRAGRSLVSKALKVGSEPKNTSTCCDGVQMTVSKAEADAEKQARNKAGLDAVLASLQAAKKANVLDKSRSDWTDFKHQQQPGSNLWRHGGAAGDYLRGLLSCHQCQG